MDNLDLATALARWLAGKRVDGHLLYTIPILWLGRLGKVFQFIGALAIVAEIVGPERLREIGAKLRSAGLRERASQRIGSSLAWMSALWANFFSREGSERHVKSKQALEGFKDHPAAILNGLMAMGAAALACYYSPFSSLWLTVPIAFVAFALTGILVGPVVSYVVVAITSGVAIISSAVLLEPMARLIDMDRPDLWIKVAAAILVTLGFLLDMLAS